MSLRKKCLIIFHLAFDIDMTDFIMRQYVDTGNRYQSIYEAKMEESLKRINLKNRVKRFAALFCGNLLALLQLTKEEHIPFLIVSYHELKVSTILFLAIYFSKLHTFNYTIKLTVCKYYLLLFFAHGSHKTVSES